MTGPMYVSRVISIKDVYAGDIILLSGRDFTVKQIVVNPTYTTLKGLRNGLPCTETRLNTSKVEFLGRES